MKKIQVRVWHELAHDKGLPFYATAGAAGMDIIANQTVHLEAKETKLIPTGLFVSIPEGYEIQIRPRSGMSLKTKLRVANAPGTIDSDYLGEIQVIMENTSGSIATTVGRGERIAQMVLCEVPQIQWIEVSSKDQLGTTERGAGGFGSTGIA